MRSTTTRIKHTTLKELNILKHTKELRSIDETIQYLLNKHELKEVQE